MQGWFIILFLVFALWIISFVAIIQKIKWFILLFIDLEVDSINNQNKGLNDVFEEEENTN